MSALVSFPRRSFQDVERPRALYLRAAYTSLPIIFQLCFLRPENPPCDLEFKLRYSPADDNYHMVLHNLIYCYKKIILSLTIKNLKDIHNLQLNLQSGISGVGGFTTFQPARLKASIWLQWRSGLDSTSPGPIMLKVASMCIGFGSTKLTV